MKCPICRKKCEALVCDSCWTLALDRLVKIPEGYQALEEELIPSQGVGERVGGSKTPPIPVKLEVLHLRTQGIKEPLLIHEARIRAQQNHTQITFRGDTYNYIFQSVRYLLGQHEWVKKNYTEIDHLVKDIALISRAINSALGHRSDLVTIGTCPTIDDTGETCGYKLQVNPSTLSNFSDIICSSCGTKWTSTRWRLLGRMLDADLPRGDENLQGVTSNPVPVDSRGQHKGSGLLGSKNV